MKVNKWTLGLAAAGLVTIPTLVQAEEKASPILTALSSTTISGFVDTSAHWDIGTGNANPPGFIYNAGKQDGFNLNKVKLRIERPLDEAQWSAGYRADLIFGPDANVYASQSSGLGSGSDFAIQQAYVALRAPVGNGLDLKLGVFDSIIGYESHDSANNPNYTRSWGTTYQPHTHTGLLATYQVAEMLGVAVGIANTVGPTINGRAHPNAGISSGTRAESYKTYMASVALTAPESLGFLEGSTLYGGVVNGANTLAAPFVQWNQTSWYVGATVNTPVENLKLGAAFDYLGVHDDSSSFGGFATAGGSAYANATALYASFQATEKLSLHARGEYSSHSFGTISTPGTGSLPGKVFSATATLQYDLWANVLSRLEFRWDHAANGDPAFGGETVGGPPERKNHYMLAANLIYKF